MFHWTGDFSDERHVTLWSDELHKHWQALKQECQMSCIFLLKLWLSSIIWPSLPSDQVYQVSSCLCNWCLPVNSSELCRAWISCLHVAWLSQARWSLVLISWSAVFIVWHCWLAFHSSLHGIQSECSQHDCCLFIHGAGNSREQRPSLKHKNTSASCSDQQSPVTDADIHT